MPLFYTDASALVKLVRDEPESHVLRTFLADADLVSCELVLTEIPRAIRRAAAHDLRLDLDLLMDRAGEVLDALGLLPLDRVLLLAAGALSEPALRALDAGMTRVGRVVTLVMPAVDIEIELGRYEAALARLDELAKTAPPNPIWTARRGEVLEKAGRPAEARAEYAKALQLIDARSVARRGKPFDDLKHRLETDLASADQRGETK